MERPSTKIIPYRDSTLTLLLKVGQLESARHIIGYRSTQETRVYNVDDDVAGNVCQVRHVMCSHQNQDTRV